MIFVNFKTYEESTGVNCLNLVKEMETAASESQVKVIPVVQPTDIKESAIATKLEVWSQKVDPISFGAHTGEILPEAVFEDGAVGTFLNHSENKLPSFEQLEVANKRALEVGLKTLIFASDLIELEHVCGLSPTFVSYEPPEFIGRTDISVATAKPEVIAKASVMAKEKNLPLIVGAGIHSMEDVKKSLELGAVGIAVATNIVKAEDPKKALLALMEGFR